MKIMIKEMDEPELKAENLLWNSEEPLPVLGSRLQLIVEDIATRSITPSTLKTRIYDRDIDEAQWYKESYEGGRTTTTRFGINKFWQEIRTSLTSDRVTIIEEKLDSSSASAASATASSNHSKTSNVSRPHKTLCTIEKELLDHAIASLLDNESRTVLVDILDRQGEAVLFTADGLVPKTHTVVLCKNRISDGTNSNGIFVIDPNNSKFSYHLDNFEYRRGADTFILKTAGDKNIKIYTPEVRYIGPGHAQYRDCVDISVKISFLLNKDAIWSTLDDTKIKFSNIQLISNLRSFDSTVPVGKIPCRIKQNSDPDIIEQFNKKQQCIDKIFAQILMQDALLGGIQVTIPIEGGYEKVKQEWIRILRDEQDVSKVIKVLGAQYQNFCMAILNTQNQKYIQAIQNYQETLQEFIQSITKNTPGDTDATHLADEAEGHLSEVTTSVIGDY